MDVRPPPKFDFERVKPLVDKGLEQWVAIASDPALHLLHFDELRFRPWPEGWSIEDVWTVVAMSRAAQFRSLPPLMDSAAAPLRYRMPIELEKIHHEATRLGSLWIEHETKTARDGAQFLASSLIEEAIASSQIEGVATTRRVAKEMIRTGRKPRTRDEHAILGNHKAMQFVRRIHREPLTPEVILEIHRLLAEGWMRDGQRGVFRTTDDVVVEDVDSGEVLHQPPPAADLPRRIRALCEFANAETGTSFVPPLVRAAALHFMVGFDHPFADGNGRTARALFHWSMLHNGLPLYEYLPVSRAIYNSRAQYERAFLYVETDAFDLTYFLNFQIRMVLRTLEDAIAYLERQRAEHRRFLQRLSRANEFNHRQRTLLERAVERPETVFTVHSHSVSQMVTQPTARRDLEELERQGLLRADRETRTHQWVAVGDLRRRLFGRTR